MPRGTNYDKVYFNFKDVLEEAPRKVKFSGHMEEKLRPLYDQLSHCLDVDYPTFYKIMAECQSEIFS